MKKFILPVLAFFFASGLFFIDTPEVFSQTNKGMVRGVDNPIAISEGTSYEGSFREAILIIVNYFLSFTGLIAVIMVIYGGFVFITTGSGDGKEKGKDLLLYAGIGILVILASFAIANTILGAGNADGTGQL